MRIVDSSKLSQLPFTRRPYRCFAEKILRIGGVFAISLVCCSKQPSPPMSPTAAASGPSPAASPANAVPSEGPYLSKGTLGRASSEEFKKIEKLLFEMGYETESISREVDRLLIDSLWPGKFSTRHDVRIAGYNLRSDNAENSVHIATRPDGGIVALSIAFVGRTGQAVAPDEKERRLMRFMTPALMIEDKDIQDATGKLMVGSVDGSLQADRLGNFPDQRVRGFLIHMNFGGSRAAVTTLTVTPTSLIVNNEQTGVPSTTTSTNGHPPTNTRPLQLQDVQGAETDESAMAILAAAETQGASPRDRARASNDRGFRLLNDEKQPDRALAFFGYAARTDSTYGMPRYSSAKCMAAKGDIDGVLRYLRELKAMGAGQRARLLTAREDPAFSNAATDPRFQALFN